MAKELYNQLEPNGADAAGVSVDQPGQQLEDKARSPYIFEVMDEVGINMRKNIRSSLHDQSLLEYKKIVVMLDDPDQFPPPLEDDPRVEQWGIPDPKFMDLGRTRQVRDQIKEHVQDLAIRLKTKEKAI